MEKVEVQAKAEPMMIMSRSVLNLAAPLLEVATRVSISLFQRLLLFIGLFGLSALSSSTGVFGCLL